MTNRPTTIDDHDPLAHDIFQVIEQFIDEIGNRGCTGHFDNVVDDNKYLKGKPLVQKPERFMEEELVFPILEDALGYSLRTQPKQYAPRWPRKGGIPDFCITSIPIETAMQNDLRFFGEVKAPKKIQQARSQMVEYLESDLDLHAIAILSDGFDWELWVRPRNTPIDELDNPYAAASLQDSLNTVKKRNMVAESYRPHQARNQIDVDGFSDFEVDAVLEIVEDEFDIGLSF